jgi:diphthamide synthase subunit DPH2
MVHIHVHREGNIYYHKTIQAYQFKNSLQNEQYHPQTSIPHNPLTQSDKYAQSGVYKLTCQDCNRAYVGQTGRDFHTRYKEHKRAFKYNTLQSKFAKHLQEHGHSFGNMENIMQVIKIQGKGTHLNTIQKFHIHKETLNNNQLNKDHAETTNLIFNTIVKFQT